ncbi:MAG: type I restriction enzyme HsdR N-terminal domain-containing protein [Bacteroidetes bacterium]|nr:type I restriction enzyme HsdR N-terminal domain-containing protein [Bacteroidota bacterium]
MDQLNLPAAALKLRSNDGKTEAWDIIRKRYIILTPEEWVRQHYVHFLINDRKVPASLIAIEVSLKYNRMSKRCDILVYDRQGKPLIIVECKAPEVKITQDVFQQIAMYNMSLKVPYLVVTNGINQYTCSIDHKKKKYTFLEELPEYQEL